MLLLPFSCTRVLRFAMVVWRHKKKKHKKKLHSSVKLATVTQCLHISAYLLAVVLYHAEMPKSFVC